MIESKYPDICQALEERIAEGIYEHRLPIAAQLAEEFGVNVKTAQKALRTLNRRGLVQTRRGQGSVVIRQLQARPCQVRSVFVMPHQADYDAPTNPWRITMMNYFYALRREADRQGAQLVMLPSALSGVLATDPAAVAPPGSALIHPGWRPPEVIAAQVASPFRHVVAFFNRDAYEETRQLPFASVTSDTASALGVAVAHLAARGRRRIAFLDTTRGQPLLYAFRQALAAYALPCLPELHAMTEDEAEIGRFLASAPPFDALIGRLPLQTLAALRLLLAGGRRIPQEISALALAGNAEVAPFGAHRLTHFENDYPTFAHLTMVRALDPTLPPGTSLVHKTLIPGTTT